MSRLKLTLVISSLAGGGAQRVMVTLANEWAATGVQVTVITLAEAVMDEYPLDPMVRRVALGVVSASANIFAALRNNARRIFALRSAIRECAPDALISFVDTTNMLCVAACLGLAIPVVVSDRTTLAASPPRSWWRLLYRPLYRRAAAVVAQTLRGATEVRRRTGREAVVIPNPLGSDAVAAARDGAVAAGTGAATLLAVGRLAPEKGFDLLIEAFARVAPAHPGWQVVILGEGPGRAELSAAISARDLHGRVVLSGFCRNPEQVMRRASLFVLSSRFEGFPNALLEAMAVGLPCVSFDCPTGPRELIDHGTNGWLVPPGDVRALAEALDLLMRDADLRGRLGAGAQRVRDAYSLPVILGKWNALLESLRERSAPKAEGHESGLRAAWQSDSDATGRRR